MQLSEEEARHIAGHTPGAFCHAFCPGYLAAKSQRLHVASYYLISSFPLSVRNQHISGGKRRGAAWDIETENPLTC